MDTIDINEPITAICGALGLDPMMVLRLDMTPTAVTAELFVPDENGAKHIDKEGRVAMETRTFKVST